MSSENENDRQSVVIFREPGQPERLHLGSMLDDNRREQYERLGSLCGNCAYEITSGDCDE